LTAQADADAVLFNSREALLGQPLTDYSQLKRCADAFEPFHSFWTTGADLNNCVQDPKFETPDLARFNTVRPKSHSPLFVHESGPPTGDIGCS
jgi:hypothetical protein